MTAILNSERYFSVWTVEPIFTIFSKLARFCYVRLKMTSWQKQRWQRPPFWLSRKYSIVWSIFTIFDRKVVRTTEYNYRRWRSDNNQNGGGGHLEYWKRALTFKISNRYSQYLTEKLVLICRPASKQSCQKWRCNGNQHGGGRHLLGYRNVLLRLNHWSDLHYLTEKLVE